MAFSDLGASIREPRERRGAGTLPAFTCPRREPAPRRRMNLIQVVDIGSLVLAAVGPALFILRWDRRGVALGAVYAWLLLLAAGAALSALDPSREMAVLDSIWLLFGWIATLLYSAVVYGAIRLIAGCRSRDDQGRARWGTRGGPATDGRTGRPNRGVLSAARRATIAPSSAARHARLGW